MDALYSSISTLGRVLVLTRAEIAGLMVPADYLEAVEAGFKASAEGRASSPPPLHLSCRSGGFHAKAARLSNGRDYAAFKINGNYPENASQGVPTIQGVIVLFDAVTGSPLCIMDSAEITVQRTAAASALAARFLARPDARVVTVCGCGAQALAQLAALAQVLPLRSGFVFDLEPDRAREFADSVALDGLRVVAVDDMEEATRASDVVVTCTTSSRAFLRLEHVRPGTFIAAVGADNPSKSEIDPMLMAAAAVTVDVLEQAAEMGDLRHALAAGAMSRGEVSADLAGLVTGKAPGRTSEAEITLFDSTGSALQDVASAARLYEKALVARAGTSVPLSSVSAGGERHD